MVTSKGLDTAPSEQTANLTDGDRIALASTALAILRLPSVLQQFSNACDMLHLLAGEPCYRLSYILGQAHRALNGYSGFQPGGHNMINWRGTGKYHDELEKLVVAALEKRQELIALGRGTAGV